jgi:dTDP-4-amino-4,6-dideoxygalactose transaminase
MSRTLRVDFEDMKLKCDDNTLVLLVHYFGFVDPMYQEICAWLDGNSIKYIEDCAHALLSDFVGGVCGRKGLYSFYSLHKLLPLSGGGMLISNTLEHFQSSLSQYNDVWTFDLKLIFETRRKNYNQLLSLLSDVPNIEILYPELPDGISPQTLPILLPKKRDELYHAMNNIGFGMVSLYHTMIDMIPEDVFPDSHFTAQHIINFPVHQDITKQDLIEMTDQFKKLYR